MIVSVFLTFFVLSNFFIVSNRVFGVLRLKSKQKTFAVIVLEIFVVASLCSLMLVSIEFDQFGAVYRQSWEFYVVLVSLMLVSMFPGFVVRFFLVHSK